MTALSFYARYCCRGLVVWLALMAAAPAAAQAVGSGPLTGRLADTEPETGVVKWGPLRLAPGLTFPMIGRDDNVFDEQVNPKRDYAVVAVPDLSMFALTRFVQVSLYGGVPSQYYEKYASERSIGYNGTGRIDFLFSRFSPFLGGGRTRSLVRPNGEIDVRANVANSEVSGGLAYSLSPHASMFLSAMQTWVDYRDATERSVRLDQSLTHLGNHLGIGVQTELTPLLKFQINGSYIEDKFLLNHIRDGKSKVVSGVFSFDPAAVVTGSASVSYRDYTPVDPLVKPFRGIESNVALTYAFLEIARVNVSFNRSMEYSFDPAEGYYITDAGLVTYTQRLFGAVDFQAQASRSFFDYGKRIGVQARRDTLDSVNGNLGYNLRNRTRVSANYELGERRSPLVPARNYVRRRIFISWLVAF